VDNVIQDHNHDVTIAVDAMGGDFGPSVTIPALLRVHKQFPDIHFLVFGDEKKINEQLTKYNALKAVVSIRHCEKTVLNEDKPSQILRSSKGTSMRCAIEAVDEGLAQAVVSAGNTGALMAMAKIVLKTLPGIHRPAIASVMPGRLGDSVMLDLGANVLVDSENLVQFAVLGAVFSKAQKKIARPSVGLLNIGTEDTKGPEHVREAAQVLSKISFPGQYHGFVEGTDITNGTVDVIVCDGYAGNIALKTAEGVGKLTSYYFKESFTKDPLAILGGFLAYYPLKRLKNKMDPRNYNGGVFLGLNGLCIKSHGGADALSFSSAVLLAVKLAKQGYIDHVAREISLLAEQETYFH